MARGTLLVKGAIDLSQFWPAGESNADTITITVSRDAFSFSPSRDKPFRLTHVFEDAFVRGLGRSSPIHDGKVKIRLEHVDAPELLYRVPVKGCEHYRQYFAETSTCKLHDLLATFGPNPIRCEVCTSVDHPGDAFDTYGRLIGQLFACDQQINVNFWLLQNGWVFPSIYNSASKSDIMQVVDLTKQAQAKALGIWPHLTAEVEIPYLTSVFRPHCIPDSVADVGPLVMPKMFRRQVAWHITEPETHRFRSFLAARADDGWVHTDEFLAHPHIKPGRRNFSTLINEQGMLSVGPSEIVLFEKPSMLVDSRGREITSWWHGSAASRRVGVLETSVA